MKESSPKEPRFSSLEVSRVHLLRKDKEGLELNVNHVLSKGSYRRKNNTEIFQ